MASDACLADNFKKRLSDLHLSLPPYPGSYPAINPIDAYRIYLTRLLHEVTGVGEDVVYPALQWTQTLDKGDLNLAVPRLRVKDIPPAQQAQAWAEKVAFPANEFILPAIVSGINLSFKFTTRPLTSLVLPCIFELGSSYGFNRANGLRNPSSATSDAKKTIIEFSSPNIAKIFHAGHLRSTIIGGFLSNLFEKSGYEVVRWNYLGDWVRQYGLLAVGWKMFGSEKPLKADPTAHLFDIYFRVSALFKPEEDAYKLASKAGQDTSQLEATGLLGQSKAYFKKMEDGNEEALALWRRFREISIEKYKVSYSRLNVFFDEYSGESGVKISSMDKAETILGEKGITENDQGAVIIDFKKHGAPKLDVAILRNRNNTTTYLLRDVGGAIQRYERLGFDEMIYVVMSEQDVHLQRLFKTLQLMGGAYKEIASKMQHVTFGKVMGMSTCKGNVKFLDDILDECGTSMHEVMQRNQAKYIQVEDPDKVADVLGISAVMVQDMKGKRINSYDFDIGRMTSFEGDTGPYLQYAHARLCSVARKAGFTHEQLLHADFSLLTERHATDLIRVMAQFPDTIGHTLKTLEPATILTYLFRLTHQLSSSYDVLRVVGAVEGPEISQARAALYDAARQVLSNGMRLLGLSLVERM